MGDHRDRPAAPTGAANREPPRRRAWPPCWSERRELGHGASTAPRDRPRQPPHWAQPEGAPRRTTDHPHTAAQVGARGLKPFPPLCPSHVIFFAQILPGFFPRFPPETLAHFHSLSLWGLFLRALATSISHFCLGTVVFSFLPITLLVLKYKKNPQKYNFTKTSVIRITAWNF